MQMRKVQVKDMMESERGTQCAISSWLCSSNPSHKLRAYHMIFLHNVLMHVGNVQVKDMMKNERDPVRRQQLTVYQ